ncbi:MAG: hypothetical protein ACX936_21105, partial [Marinobacter sp.]
MHTPLPEPLKTAAAALRAAFSSQPQTASVVQNERFPVVWDSGASMSVSPHKSDFVGPLKSPPLGL